MWLIENEPRLKKEAEEAAERARIRAEEAAVAEAARQGGVEALVHLSALGADSQSPAAYGRSKAQGEEAVREQPRIAGPQVLPLVGEHEAQERRLGVDNRPYGRTFEAVSGSNGDYTVVALQAGACHRALVAEPSYPSYEFRHYANGAVFFA